MLFSSHEIFTDFSEDSEFEINSEPDEESSTPDKPSKD